MRHRRTASLVAMGVAAALLPALTPASASASGAAPEPRAAAVDPLGQYTRQKPRWKRCEPEGPAHYECATIKVPLDYSRPDGRKLDVEISRTRATGTEDRRGVLLLNPGGPGNTGLDMPVYLGPQLPDAVKQRYDLIGFDPRGVGRSSPVGCGLTDAELNWQRPYKAATFDKDVRWARTVAEKCRAANGAVLPHLSTRNTARDMDVIRAVLGEKRISYLGYSYGTYLGAVYTQLFPQRTDRFVLDSAVDPERIWRGMIQVWAEGSEPAFTRWTEWTAARNATYKLGRTPAEVRKTFWDLVAGANRTPIPVDGVLVSGDDIRSWRAMFFYVTDAAETVVMLKEAAAGKAPAPSASPSRRGLPTAPVPPSSARNVPADNGDALFWSVVCADTRAWPRDPERYRRDAIRDRAKYPLYGDFASHIKPCAFWGKGAEPATRIGNTVRALVLQNEWDPQTPLVSGQGMRRALKGSRMVTVLDGLGHGVYGSGSCADAIGTAYLVTGRLPAADVSCRTPEGRRTDAPRLAPSAPRDLPGLPGRSDRF
ncbi:alpha/beta hydrolase [Streptomyces sp. NPDC086147]|uniref:alpha/beta hydrolase n=1 Tax=Streptomyces sp. NPDC086147 TaxID=3155295 RepID=UPI00344DB50C